MGSENYIEDNVWKPWGNSDGISQLGQQLLPKISEAKLYFQSDSKLDVRFKLYPQPTDLGGEYCYGRKQGVEDKYPYTKVTFKISLRDVSCGSGENNCSLGDKYNTRNGRAYQR